MAGLRKIAGRQESGNSTARRLARQRLRLVPTAITNVTV